MSLLSNLLLAAATLSLQANAQNTHIIVVGKDGLNFTNADLKANKGDILEFRFWATNHSVVQGNWDTACQPNDDGFFSGFVPTAPGGPNDQVFKVTLEDTNPKVYYCSQGKHCANGMVGVINGLGERTFAAYKDAAKALNTTGATPQGQPKGGEFAALQASTPTPTGGNNNNNGGDDNSNSSPSETSSTSSPSGSSSGSGSGAGSIGVSLGALVAAGLFAVALV